MTIDPSSSLHAYLDHALGGDARQAVDVALELLDAGVPGETVIADLLAVAQRQVGDRWHRNELSVADEHLATGTASSALHALGSASPRPRRSATVVVTCAEGDWHSLAAHMFAEQLRARGVAVAFLGASTPADHVARFVERHRPYAVAVSCNLPLFYPGVFRLTEAAHAFGLPVLAGGRALRDHPERAQRLGADASADDIDEAVPVLAGWLDHPPPLARPARLDPAAVELDAFAGDLAATAFGDLILRFPSMAGYDANQLARTREDLGFIVQFVAAAQLVDDATVLTEFLDWLTALLAPRGVPKVAVVAGLEVLQPLLLRTSPTAGGLAAVGLAHLAQAG